MPTDPTKFATACALMVLMFAPAWLPWLYIGLRDWRRSCPKRGFDVVQPQADAEVGARGFRVDPK